MGRVLTGGGGGGGGGGSPARSIPSVAMDEVWTMRVPHMMGRVLRMPLMMGWEDVNRNGAAMSNAAAQTLLKTPTAKPVDVSWRPMFQAALGLPTCIHESPSGQVLLCTHALAHVDELPFWLCPPVALYIL